ncbi:MAG: type II toxin-antitoxin system HicA family toxin [Candidatus Aenigmarchaeota archaeon]|nr:type II toxin-antitoxin system HicA family toxin [Candidatus Aenigmarchaeota archaeon]
MKLVLVSGKKMCKILESLGFQKIHQVGSHIRYVHPDGRKTVVPAHGNESSNIPLPSEILQQTKISRVEYERLRLNI